MKKCNWIETILNIRPETLSPCCFIHCSQIPLYKIEKGERNIEKYKKFISEIYKEIQTKSKFCHGCEDLVDGKPDLFNSEDLVFKKILINIHENLCNCKCIYCPIDTRIEPMDDNLLGDLISELQETESIDKNTIFDWGGGESSVFKGFYKYAPILADKGYSQHVFTNAIVYSPVIGDLLEKDLIKITTSLDSHDRNSFITMKRVDKFNNAVNTISRYLDKAKNKNSVIVKYIITSKNCDLGQIDGFLSLCQDMGVQVILVSPDFQDAKHNAITEKIETAAAHMFTKAKEMGSFKWCGPFFNSQFENIAKDVFHALS